MSLEQVRVGPGQWARLGGTSGQRHNKGQAVIPSRGQIWFCSHQKSHAAQATGEWVMLLLVIMTMVLVIMTMVLVMPITAN